MKVAAYSFKNNRLTHTEDASEWKHTQVVEYCRTQHDQGLTVVMSNIGRAVCDVCKADLGARPGIAAGQLSHGKCRFHYEEALREIQ